MKNKIYEPKNDKKYLITLPKTRSSLKEYMKNIYNIDVPDKPICDGHCSPFDFVYDTIFEKTRNIIAIGSRGSGKTLDIAAIDAFNCNFKKNCETGTVGAVVTQAKKCYSYFQKMIRPYMNIGRVEKSCMNETKFIHPINSILSILVGTMTGVNSPHPNKAFLDEFELVQWHIFQEFLNMAISEHGLKAQVILTSTRKTAFGTVERFLRQRIDMKYDLYIWCVWEVTEKCNEISCNECKKLVKGFNDDGSPRSFHSVCQGKLKHTNGFRKIDDIKTLFLSLDRQVWEAQQECKKPSKEGTVFYWFDDAKHVYSKDIDIYSENCNIWEGIDWGGNDPSVCTFWAELNGIFYMFDEIYVKGVAPSDFAILINEKRDLWKIKDKVQGTYCDPSSLISRLELEKHKIFTIPANNDILEGINIMNSMGSANRIFINNRCKNSIIEFSTYHYSLNENFNTNAKIKPVDRDNHTVDSSRYVFNELKPTYQGNSAIDFVYNESIRESLSYMNPEKNIGNEIDYETKINNDFFGFSTSNSGNSEISDVFYENNFLEW